MPKSLYQNWEFAIEVNGFDVALFRKGQEPKIEFEEVAFAPAGSMFDQKEAGHVKFEDITLENGVLQGGSDEAARDWMKSQVDVYAVTGGWPDDYMRKVDVVRYDRAGDESRRWNPHGAWIKTLEYDELVWARHLRRVGRKWRDLCFGRGNAQLIACYLDRLSIGRDGLKTTVRVRSSGSERVGRQKRPRRWATGILPLRSRRRRARRGHDPAGAGSGTPSTASAWTR